MCTVCKKIAVQPWQIARNQTFFISLLSTVVALCWVYFIINKSPEIKKGKNNYRLARNNSELYKFFFWPKFSWSQRPNMKLAQLKPYIALSTFTPQFLDGINPVQLPTAAEWPEAQWTVETAAARCSSPIPAGVEAAVPEGHKLWWGKPERPSCTEAKLV